MQPRSAEPAERVSALLGFVSPTTSRPIANLNEVPASEHPWVNELPPAGIALLFGSGFSYRIAPCQVFGFAFSSFSRSSGAADFTSALLPRMSRLSAPFKCAASSQ